MKKLLNHTVSRRALMWLCVAALLVSLVPLYTLSFYNHPCYDDFGYTVRTHAVWRDTGSVWQTLKMGVRNTVDTRNTWEGNYASTFLNSIQPALWGESLYGITGIILLTGFLLALWLFLRQTLVCELHADQTTFWLLFSACALVMMQFVPSLSEAFYWFAGGMAYTFLWSVMLVRMSLQLALRRAQTGRRQALLYALLTLATVAVGGSKFSTVLLAILLDGLWLMHGFVKRQKTRFGEWALTALLLVCFAYCATSPGNAVRAETLHSAVGAPKAVLQAFYFGFGLMGHWFSLPLMVLWALAAWQLAPALSRSRYRFRHPVWATLVCACLFCAQLAPTLVTGNYLGDGRSLNSYFFTYVLMGGFTVLYWLGWAQRRSAAPVPMTADGLRFSALLAALVLLVVGCVSYHPDGALSYGPQYMASGSALRALVSGQAAAYDAAMDERDRLLNDPTVAEPELRIVQNIPEAFMGDALNSRQQNYVLSLYGEYYQKQRVSVAKEE